MRRERIMAWLLLICLLLAACGEKEETSGDWRVMVATDLHYLAPSLTDHGPIFRRMMENSDGKITEYCDEITDAFLDQVLAERPEALILTGDLSFNGERESHLALAAKLASLEEQGIAVLVLPGNHDLYRSQTYAYFGDSAEPVPSVTAEEFREIYAPFGFAEAIAADDDSLSYTARLNESSRVLMLDANTLHDFCGLSEKTLAWTEDQLREARQAGETVLVCCHQNLYQHSMFGAGYVLDRAEQLHALLEQYGVPLMLSGHMHIQHIASRDGVTEIATSALTMGACQYGIVEAKGEKLRYEARPVQVSAWAAEQGSTDGNLLDFESYARSAMTRRTRIQAEQQLRAKGFAEEEIGPLTDFACALNEAYFAGDLSGIPDLDPEGELLRRWADSGSFFGYYFASLQEDLGRDHTRWEMKES